MSQPNRPYAPTKIDLSGIKYWKDALKPYTFFSSLPIPGAFSIDVIENPGWNTVVDVSGSGVLFFFGVAFRNSSTTQARTGGADIEINGNYIITPNQFSIAPDSEEGACAVGSILWDLSRKIPVCIKQQPVHFDEGLKLEAYMTNITTVSGVAFYQYYLT